MGQVKNEIISVTDDLTTKYHNIKAVQVTEQVASIARDTYDAMGNALIFALEKAWLGIGLVKPAKTDKEAGLFNALKKLKVPSPSDFQEKKSATPEIDRFDYTQLWSVQLSEDYFLPLSQTFTLRGKKRLNVASLVDGIDIIQQTRKEAKTIDCSIRISLRENQDTLHIVNATNKMQELSAFVADLYESDTVFSIANETINNVFGVTYVMLTEFKFIPKAGSLVYQFDFTLTEVKYGENVLTFNLNQVDSDQKSSGQIGG